MSSDNFEALSLSFYTPGVHQAAACERSASNTWDCEGAHDWITSAIERTHHVVGGMVFSHRVFLLVGVRVWSELSVSLSLGARKKPRLIPHQDPLLDGLVEHLGYRLVDDLDVEVETEFFRC